MNKRRRRRRPKIIHRIVKAGGGKRKLAAALSITEQSINNWRRIPRKRLMRVHQITGIPLAELAPDLFA